MVILKPYLTHNTLLYFCTMFETTEAREAMDLYADNWYADVTNCITQDLICGNPTNKYNNKLLTVYLLRSLINCAIEQDRLINEQIDILYGRLECLIGVAVES